MEDSRLELLVESGLTEVQARVYTALAALGHTTAREVSELAGIPRTRVYGILKTLHGLNLVREEPAGLVAGPLGPYLDRRAVAASKRHAALLARRRTLSQTCRPTGPPPPPHALRLARGPTLPVKLLARALERTQESLEASFGVDSLVGTLASAEAGAAFRDALQRLPRTRLVIHADARDAESLEDAPSDVLLKARISLREGWAYDRLVLDGDHLLMRLAHTPISDRPAEGSDMVLATRHPGLVRDARAVLQHAWQTGRTPLTDLREGPHEPSHPDAEGGRA